MVYPDIGVTFHSDVLFLLLMCFCVIFLSQATSVPMHKFADFKKHTFYCLFLCATSMIVMRQLIR